MYDDHYMNTDFDYEDMEAKYEQAQNATQTTPDAIKSQLDAAHK